MSERLLALVNPAAGGGRCGRLARPALERLRAQGIDFEVRETHAPGEGSALVRQAYAEGWRRFLAVGGDGTAYEIVNGLFPEAERGPRPVLTFLPLGTGNSFLRDFSSGGAEAALRAGHERPCDVIRLRHAGGTLHYINLMTLGFAADVAALTNRRFKGLGPAGYLLGVLVCLARLRRRAFPLRVDEDAEMDRRPCLFLSFSNSKFTGGKMLIAPRADTNDGLIEYVRWGPIGRLRLLWNLRRLYDGSHIHHAQASRRPARRIEFEMESAVTAMVDGEVLELECRSLEVLPGALTVVA